MNDSSSRVSRVVKTRDSRNATDHVANAMNPMLDNRRDRHENVGVRSQSQVCAAHSTLEIHLAGLVVSTAVGFQGIAWVHFDFATKLPELSHRL